MLLNRYLRKPVEAEDARDGSGIFLRETDKIAIIVMPHVFMIYPGQRGALILCALVFLIVLHDKIHPVGIMIWYHHVNDTVKVTFDERVIRGDKLPGDQRGSLARRHLGGVHRQGGKNEDPAIRYVFKLFFF